MKQLVLEIARPPAPTLDNFVPGRNEELVAALYATAHGASSEQFIYMWGAPGSGQPLRATQRRGVERRLAAGQQLPAAGHRRRAAREGQRRQDEHAVTGAHSFFRSVAT